MLYSCYKATIEYFNAIARAKTMHLGVMSGVGNTFG